MDARITAWLDLAAPARGLKFVSYHAHWAYFADRFGFDHIGTIEMRPGIEPTPRHVQNLVELMPGKPTPPWSPCLVLAGHRLVRRLRRQKPVCRGTNEEVESTPPFAL